MEFRIDNPCDRIGPVLGPQQDVTEHMQALPHREVAAVIRTVRASAAVPAAGLAFEFLVLTAARWGEVRWAEWEEIDRGREGVDRPGQAGKDEPPAPGAAVWTCPGDSQGGAGTGGGSRSTGVSPMGAGSLSMTASCAACCASLGFAGGAARVPLDLPGLGG